MSVTKLRNFTSIFILNISELYVLWYTGSMADEAPVNHTEEGGVEPERISVSPPPMVRRIWIPSC